MKSIPLLLVLLVTSSIVTYGQDLLSELQQDEKKEKDYTIATFKGTRIINGHSVEMKGAGELEFIISHRFGTINSGSYNLFGLDQAYIRIGLEYGITDRLGVGIGRSSFNKIYDSYLKYKLLRQSTGPGSSPFTITAFGSINIQDFEQTPGTYTTYMDRASYISQLLIARKFSPKFSAQLTPTFIHTNVVDKSRLTNDQVAMGFGARYKLTKSLALNAEYFYRVNPLANTPYYNSLGIGLDIETGGHVFQLVLSNTQGMIERTFVTETADNFFDGGIHFGFNITRAFQLKKKTK
jgi:opacity protein-like surface antigen